MFRIKEVAMDVTLYMLLITGFSIFKVVEKAMKLKKTLTKQPIICIRCGEPVRRGNGLDLGDGEGRHRVCLKGG